ncbi:17649_t:CDS:2, partial [Funneliformis geosporum]
MSCFSRASQVVLPNRDRNEQNTLLNNLIEESKRLRKNLYLQGAARHLSDKDFQNYKLVSINNFIRNILKNLKIFTVIESLEELTKKIAEYIDEIMPLQFIQLMLILSKNQLHKYKLHKIVSHEYNKYIQETCQ